ncbi:MAG: hypothetical protein ACJASV_002874 [Pseudorhodobacter sp.]|jgi:uncharacterized protein (TIGR02302 family)
MTQKQDKTLQTRLRWPLLLTLAGLWAERLIRGFWPFWSVLLTILAFLVLGLQDFLPRLWLLAGFGLAGLVAFWALFKGWRGFHKPNMAQALARLDATLPGRPIATLNDHQAIGSNDPASRAVWAAHLARMARIAAGARAVSPDLTLASRDRFGLRYMALTALVTALIFGSLWRVASVTGLGAGPAQALIAGPSWEGWVQPPPYTGKPTLYLNEIDLVTFEVPTGSRVQLRFYGEVGALSLVETVSGRAPDPAEDAAQSPTQEFDITQSGAIGIEGPGGKTWNIVALKDALPHVEATDEVAREADGRMKLPFSARDDHGIQSGQARITLDLAGIDRRFGLLVDPEPIEPILLDLPLPITGNRADFTEILIEDLSKHVMANLPVTVRLSVKDAADQEGIADPLAITLPGKRFFDPLAAAVIEMRRDLLWSRSNAARSVQVFRAVTNHPEGFIRNERAYLRLRVALRRLDAEAVGMSLQTRDELAEALWEIALMIEEGDLASARERLQRAQDRLDEAIRNGADPSEIEELMQELRQAMDDYMRQLAQEAERNPDGDAAQEQQGMEMTGDQLQDMLEELQKLLEEGRMAEAAELMEMLRQLMENMQVTQGEGGQGSPGQQAMRDLGETLREQQDLSDDSFSELQNQDGQQGQEEGQQEGQEPGQDGQNGDSQQGQNQQGTGEQGEGQGQGLSQRQRDLRNQLGNLNGGNLPGAGSEQGEAGRRALDEAGRSMEEAERALRDGDLPGALDRQADAMRSLREGMRDLGEAMAQEQRENNGNQQGEAVGRADPNSTRDPLGREPGDGARIGSDSNLLQGDDVYRRAQDLLDEIRRRQGDQARPENERDYLKRLLDLF